MRNFSWVGTGLLLLLPLSLAAAPKVTGKAGALSSSFTISEATQVPGTTLAPGKHTIKILDRLTDRMIVRIERNGTEESTFLGLPSSGLSGANGPISIGSGKGNALRGFVFDNGFVAEFVYPKGEAVDLAKANNMKIPAIDPASQGMAENPALSKTDRTMVTLWMLSPTAVGPNDQGPGIKAERYQEVASAGGAPKLRAEQRPVVKALPHTAGMMPLVVIVGVFSLMGGFFLTGRRVLFG